MHWRFIGLVGLAGLTASCGRFGFDAQSVEGADAAPDAAPDARPIEVRELIIGSESIVDSSILESDPARNCGVCQHINGGNIEAGLIRIDLAALPGNAVIVSATLELYLNALFTPGGDIDVYAVTEEWVEGESEGSPGSPNWTERAPGILWSSPGVGADSRSPSPLATIVPLSLDAAITVVLPAALATQWHDEPAQNFGIALKGKDYPGNGGDHPHFFSTESNTVDRHPRLIVRYFQP